MVVATPVAPKGSRAAAADGGSFVTSRHIASGDDGEEQLIQETTGCGRTFRRVFQRIE